MKYSLNALLFFLLPVLVSAQDKADSLLQFITVNKNRASFYLVQNDTVVAKLNENKIMPLASTVKILVALEFAKQAAAGVISEEEKISLNDLNRFYLPNTDGNAHPQWLDFEKAIGHINNDSIKLIDVARGMMIFSSNANTEYLMGRLGMDNVKNNIQLLGVKNHTAIFPVVSSLFLFQNPKGKNEEQIIKGLRKLTDEEYSRFSYAIYAALKNDSTLKSKFRPRDLSEKMQRTWSDRLPASTTKDYAHISSTLNNRRFFDENTYGIIADVMEYVMENPANQKWLKHAGMKGGSTPWVLTKSMYATTKEGLRIELAYFFNDLTPAENSMLQKWMNSFELKLLTSKEFRKKISESLKD